MSEYDFRKLYENIYGEWRYGDGFQIHPDKTALVIIDMQPAFSSSKVGMGKAYSTFLTQSAMQYFDGRVQEVLIPNHVRLLECCRREKIKVVFVVTQSETDDLSDTIRYYRRAIADWEEAIGEQAYQ